ncbi:CidA/LrgA family protein [Paenibacillus sp. YYML68]|uniref:CidA/LrgA family protein n=1 Tax=Paenibacillus sp. YYML68 TaxID=2909250 RepID=UPI0024908EFB|nr:CidA/LrgA family protein [Paenibacillus sp. YYML68]
MVGIAILLTFYGLGVLLQSLLELPIPANVLGMLLFVAALFSRIVKLEQVEAAAQFLLRHMLLLFVPLVVGTMTYYRELAEQALLMIVSLVVSTFGVMLITGWTTRTLARKAVHEGAGAAAGRNKEAKVE